MKIPRSLKGGVQLKRYVFQVKSKKIVSIMLMFIMMVTSIILTPLTVEAADPYTLTLDDITFDTSTGEISLYTNTTEKDIIIPASFNISGTDYPVKSIGDGAFYSNDLTSVIISDNVTSIGGEAFYNNDLRSITIPNNVKSIGNYAFCSNDLRSITIPNNVTTIGDYAFSTNYNLASITIGNSVVSIGEYAFAYNINSPTKITIPDSVMGIGASAFYANSGSPSGSIALPATPVITGYDTPVWTNSDGIVVTEIAVGSGALRSYTKTITATDYSIKYNLNGGIKGSNPTTYTIEDATITLAQPTKAGVFFDGWYSDLGCTAGNEVVEIPSGSTGNLELWAKWKTYHTLTLSDVTFDETTGTIMAYNTTETDIIIPASFNVSGTDYDVINIGANAFEFKSLTGVILPDSVENIGTSAFKDNSLARIIIPNNIESIGQSALENNSLTILAIPNSVMSIGAGAFTGNSLSIGTIVLPVAGATGYNDATWADDSSSVTTINDFISSYTKILGTPITYNITYNLDSGINNSGNPATYDIETATITLASPTRKGYAFDGWYSDSGFTSGVTEITLGSTGDKVLFAKWTIASYTLTLSDVIFDATTGTIINYLSSARDIIIPASFNVSGRNYPVTNIGDTAFYGRGLVSLNIPNSVIDIGAYAFAINILTSLTIRDSVKNIAMGAFEHNDIANIDIPNSVESIGAIAFANNGLTSVTIGNSVRSIGIGAFSDNAISLTSIDLPDNGTWTTYNWGTNSNETVTAITDFDGGYWKTVSGGSTSGGGGGGSSFSNTKTPTEELEDAINNTTPNSDGIVEVLIELEADNDGIFSFKLPENFVGDDEVEVTVLAGDVKVILSNTMFNSWEDTIEIAVKPVEIDELNLPDEVKEMIGDLPVYDISLEINGKKVEWESDTDIEIAIGLDEDRYLDEHKFVAVFIDDEGNVELLKFSLLSDGVMNFSTTHLSDYAVAYVDKTFEDLDSYSWAKEAIEALAARSVINGTSDTTFSPALSITRADFVTLIVRYFGFISGTEGNFSDVADGMYYTESIAIAKDLGIITGSGDNMFKPTSAITRQDMMVILMRALEVAGQDEMIELVVKTYESFDDSDSVANYAEESVNFMIKTGIIKGSNNKINPTSEITRAEVAQALYNLLKVLGE